MCQLSNSACPASLTDTKLNDYGQNYIRPALANVQGTSVPYPYGGKPRHHGGFEYVRLASQWIITG